VKGGGGTCSSVSDGPDDALQEIEGGDGLMVHSQLGSLRSGQEKASEGGETFMAGQELSMRVSPW
jgi:hypothetical protein